MVINEIAPFNQVRVKHKAASWMCRETLVSIRKGDSFFQRFKRDKGKKGAYIWLTVDNGTWCKER